MNLQEIIKEEQDKAIECSHHLIERLMTLAAKSAITEVTPEELTKKNNTEFDPYELIGWQYCRNEVIKKGESFLCSCTPKTYCGCNHKKL